MLREWECDGVLIGTSYSIECPLCSKAIILDDEGKVLPCTCINYEELI